LLRIETPPRAGPERARCVRLLRTPLRDRSWNRPVLCRRAPTEFFSIGDTLHTGPRLAPASRQVDRPTQAHHEGTGNSGLNLVLAAPRGASTPLPAASRPDQAFQYPCTHAPARSSSRAFGHDLALALPSAGQVTRSK